MSQVISSPLPARSRGTVFPVLGAISLCHMLNDMMQSLLPAIYPILKGGFHLDFGQIGLLTLIFQITASLLQPMIGRYTDARPQPYSLSLGMGFTMVGMVTLGLAESYAMLLVGAALLGVGSSIFHPESSRIARLASGGQHGLAQSVFQVGGNVGQSLGPLLAAFLILPHGQGSLAWFGFVAFGGMGILGVLGHWYKAQGHAKPPARAAALQPTLPSAQVRRAMTVLIGLMFSKFFYLASFTS
ncbi:MAG: MFS transporter, partial [Acidocella sp.]|nr:MFS transporter [Acidocella sp.]